MDYDPYERPRDDAELFDRYYDYVQRLVRKLGIPGREAEDVTCDILCRFYERKMLQKYDPSLKFEFEGEARPARFQTFLSSFVALYCRGIRERSYIRGHREPLLCDKPVTSHNNGMSKDLPWIEVYGPIEPERPADVEVASLFQSVRAYLVTVPKRSDQDICNLPRLWDLMMEQTLVDGKVHVPTLMKEFQVSSTAIHSWIRRLREQVTIALAGLGYPEGLGYWDGLGYERTERGWAMT